MASCFLCQIFQSSALTLLIVKAQPPNFNPSFSTVLACRGNAANFQVGGKAREASPAGLRQP